MIKIIVTIGILLLFLGCGGKGLNIPFLNQDTLTDSSLPKVNNINYLISSSSVAFEWEPSYSSKIDGYKIYKKIEGDEKFQKVATISNRYSSHYVDNNIQPTSFYTYKFFSYSNNNTISNASKDIRLTTQRRIEKVPVIKAIVGLPDQIKIIWRPHPNRDVNGYIVQRSTDAKKWEDIQTLRGRLQSEYIDDSLGNSVIYRYRVLAFSENAMNSYPSAVVVGKTKSLPGVVANLEASNNLSGKIKLSFNHSNISDRKYYIIYRSLFKNFLYMQVAKIRQNFYIDNVNIKDKTYFYKVTVVDKDNLESFVQKDIIMGKTK